MLRSIVGLLALSSVLGCVGVADKLIASSRLEAANIKVDNSCATPQWQVADQTSSDACGGIFDYCLRVNCTIAASGSDPAQGEVAAVYMAAGGIEFRKKSSLAVNPGASRAISFDFSEAELAHSDITYRCEALQNDCARVSCDVTNTGDAAGTGEVTLSFEASNGAVKTGRKSVNLAVGQTRSVSYDFPGFQGGTGRCAVAVTP